MVDPATALIVFGGLVGAAALLFWPRRGLIERLRRLSHVSERVLMEDALKHVYTCNSIGRPVSLASVAGQLEVTTSRAAELLRQLGEAGHIRNEADGAVLTPTGRDSALQLVRTHRLWERYLADRTGVPPGEWHEEAERMEHRMSADQVERLATSLGHPAWDPHGDPIPTADGVLPRLSQPHLTTAEVGRTVEIVHLEDEPSVIYEALLEDVLDLGSRVELVSRSDTSVRIRAMGRQWDLDNLVAANVTVRELPEGETADDPIVTLADVPPGSRARVLGISPACQGSQRRRLLDLGVVRGTEIAAAMSSATGDPVAYMIRGALIALRSEQAGWIRVERLPAEDVNEADKAEVA